MNKDMDKDRRRRILTIVTLILGTIVVALGYATLSDSLAISTSATVNPDTSLFSVVFSSDANSVIENPIVPTLNKTAPLFTATSGTINNTNTPIIENMHVTFTEPGQSVTYKAYAHNTGKYLAYLKSITFSGTKTCTPKSGTSPNLVASACNGITFSVKVGKEAATSTSVSSITNHLLYENYIDEITVVITYETGSQIADGDFDVTLPNVSLSYDSAD